MAFGPISRKQGGIKTFSQGGTLDKTPGVQPAPGLEFNRGRAEHLCAQIGYWNGNYYLDEDYWSTFDPAAPPDGYNPSASAASYCCYVLNGMDGGCPDNGLPAQWQDQYHHATLSMSQNLVITGQEPHPSGNYTLYDCQCGPAYPVL